MVKDQIIDTYFDEKNIKKVYSKLTLKINVKALLMEVFVLLVLSQL